MRTWRFADAAARYDVVDENKFRRAIEQALQVVSVPPAGQGGTGSLEVDNAGAVVSYGVNDLNFSNEFVATVTQAAPTVIVGVSLATTQPSAHTWSADQTFSSHVIIGTDPGGTSPLRVGGHVTTPNDNAATYYARNAAGTADVGLLGLDSGNNLNLGRDAGNLVNATQIFFAPTQRVAFFDNSVTERMRLTTAALSPAVAGGITAGTASLPWSSIFTNAGIYFYDSGVQRGALFGTSTANRLRFVDSGSVDRLYLDLQASIEPATNGQLTLGTSTNTWGNAYFNVASALFWYNGATNNGYLQIDGTPSFSISLGGTLRANMTQSAFTPFTSAGLTLGIAALPWSTCYLKSNAPALLIDVSGGSGSSGRDFLKVTLSSDNNAATFNVVSTNSTWNGFAFWDATNAKYSQVGVGTAPNPATAFALQVTGGALVNTAGLGVLTGNIGVGIVPQPGIGIYDASTQNTVSSYGYFYQGQFNSGVTTTGAGVRVLCATQAAAFTLPNLYNIWITAPTKGAGSTITTLYGVYIENMTAGGTNYAIYTNTGPIHFGDTLGLSALPVSYIGVYNTFALSGNAQQYGEVLGPTGSSAATTSIRALQTQPATAAAAFTCGEVTSIAIQDATKGAGSTITTQYGIYINSQTQGGTNYAIFTNTGQVSLGDNLYVRANATVGIGIAPVAFNALYINGITLSGGSPQAGVVSSPTFGSAATLAFPIFAQLVTAAASFTLTQGMGVYISDATKGAGSTITTQYGLYVVSQTKGGTNYAIYTNTGQVALGDDLNFYSTATGVFDHTMTRFGGGAAPAVTNDVWSYDGVAAKWRPRFLQVEVKTGVLVAAANGDGTFSTFAFDGRTPAGTSVAGPTPTVTAIYGGFIVDMGTTPPSGFVWDVEWTNSANGNTGGPVRITSQEMVFQFFSNNSSVPFGTTATTFQFKVSQTGATAAVYGTASTALAASTRTEVNAYGLIVASQIACVNLAAISADLGICAAGVITDAIPTASQTKGIFIKSTAFETSVPAGWLTGIFFSGANPPPVTVTGPYIDFTATGTNLWLKGPSGNFTVDASGNVVVKGVLQVQLGASSTFAKVGGLLFDIGGYTQTATVISSTTTTTITSIAIGANAWNATGRGIRFTITGRFIQNAVGSQNTITVRLCYGGTTTAFNLFTSAGMGTLTTNQSFILVGMINVTNGTGTWGQANALQSLGAPNGTGAVTGLNNAVGGSTSTGVTAATLYLVYDQTGGASNISVTFNMDSCVVEYV